MSGEPEGAFDLPSANAAVVVEAARAKAKNVRAGIRVTPDADGGVTVTFPAGSGERHHEHMADVLSGLGDAFNKDN